MHGFGRHLTAALLVGLSLAVSASGWAASNAEVSASVEPSRVAVGDMVTLTIRAKVRGNEPIRMVEKPGVGSAFQVLHRSRFPQRLRINNVVRRAKIYKYRMKATEPGRHTIEPPVLDVGGRRMSPPAQIVEVGDAAPPAQEDARGSKRDDKLFVRAKVGPSKTPYLGQQITLVYHLMTARRIFNVRPHPPKEPSLDSFWIEDLSRKFSRHSTTTHYDGRLYKQTTLRAYALFPLETGEVQIEPMSMKVEVGDFFSQTSQTLQSDPITLKVRPLPDGAPPGFYEGNVGRWNFRAELQEDTTKLGAPVTLEYEVSGRGNIRRVEVPKPPEVDGLKIDRVDTSVEKRIRGANLYGTKTVEFRVSPRREGDFTLPRVSFVHFDPEEGSYKTTKSRAFDLSVRGGQLPKGTATENEDTDEGSDDEQDPVARLLGQLAGPITTVEVPYTPARPLQSTSFLTLAAIPSLGLLLLLFGPPLARTLRRLWGRGASRREARKRADALLEEAREASPPEAARGVSRALTAYLHLRWAIPRGAVTAAEIDETLTEYPIPADLRTTAAELLAWSEEARFAPAADTDAGRVERALDETETLLERLHGLGDDADERDNDENAGAKATVVALAAGASVLVGLGVVGPAGQARARSDFQSHVREALDAHRSGDWSGAIDRWQSLLAARPHHPALQYNLGTAAAQDRQFGMARAALERAAATSPRTKIRQNLELVARIVDHERLQAAPGTTTVAPSPAAGMDRWRLARTIPAAFLPWALIGAAWLLFLGLLARKLTTTGTRPRFAATTALVVGLTASLLVAALWAGRSWTLSTVQPGVVTASNVDLRAGPTPHAELLAPEVPVMSGVAGRVLTRRDGWVEIAVSSETTGWLPEAAVDVVERPG